MKQALRLLLCGAATSLASPPVWAGPSLSSPRDEAPLRDEETGLAPGAGRAEAVARARRHFSRAVELYRAGAYDASLAEFTRAYEAAPAYRILYNLAQLQAQRQDYVQAIELFERYLAEGELEIPAARAAAVRAEMQELSRRVAELHVSANVDGATLRIDDERLLPLPLSAPIRINAGIRRLRVEKSGYSPLTRTITVAAEEHPELRFELQPEPERREPKARPTPLPYRPLPPPRVVPQPNPAVWVGLATTGALAGATAAFGVLTYLQSAELNRRLAFYPEGLEATEAARARLSTWALFTEGFGLASLVAAGVTAYLHFTAPDASEPAQSPRWAAGITSDGNGVWVGGAL